MKLRLPILLLVCALLAPLTGSAVDEPCAETPRLPHDNPVFAAQRSTFGFHDEELILCSPGAVPGNAIHIAARLWVPESCPGVGGCAGVVIGHGLGFNKETTFADMLAVVRLGMYALSYDVRGQGGTGGQAALLGRDDIADQAAVLRWWHGSVRPTKTAFYGISQGGWLSWTAAEFNCGAARAAAYDSSVPCNAGGRWIDAIAPMQSPMRYQNDGTCSVFAFETFVYSRGNPSIGQALSQCFISGRIDDTPGAFIDVFSRLGRVDVPVYAVTSFYDRLVSPKVITEAYEKLRARTKSRKDPLYRRDVRLLLSNDAHGSVGGNLAVTGDVFAWIDNQIDGGPPLRAAPVAIAQEWAADAFRLERSWPIAGTTSRTFYLGRDGAGILGPAPAAPGRDELRNLPVVASPPEVPFVGAPISAGGADELPNMRLVYATAPLGETLEVTGQPSVSLWVSSSNAASQGTGQLHLFLSELAPDGTVTTFAQAVRGLTGLGPTPVRLTLPLSLSAHRVDAGNRLILAIAPSDVLVVMPARGADPFYVNHGSGAPSSLTIPLAPLSRTAPPGAPPAGAAYTDDPIGAICGALGIDCG